MLLYFAVTLFVSASLLFLVQPMVGKMILPQLGGTPAVWNTCMVFFQAVLLIGYGYTHSLTTWFTRRWQLVAQMTILVIPLAFLMLPFAIPASWTPPEEDNPIFSVLWLLLGMVGLPFFVVATSAPLLQKWFADTGHPAGKDPYFLYGASNLGSMLALVLYPLVVEPLFPTETQVDVARTALRKAEASVKRWEGELKKANDSTETVDAQTQLAIARQAFLAVKIDLEQAQEEDHSVSQPWLWTGGYALLILLVQGCMIIVWKAHGPQPQLVGAAASIGETPPPGETPTPAAPAPAAQAPRTAARKQWRRGGWKAPQQPEPAPVLAPAPARPITAGRRLRWLALAAAPSSLMLGVTTHLTTDVAAIPFFWVIPLALYLLTFILVFSRWPIVWTERPHTVVLYMQPFLLAIVVMYLVDGTFRSIWIAFTLHVLMFFLTTLMCHGELAKDRPGTKDLTEYYLWMSLGGVLGGTFNALVAPLIFWTGTIEYPLAMVCSYFLRPKMIGQYVLIPGDTDAYETTVLGRVMDLVFPLVIGLWTWVVFFTAHKLPYFSEVRSVNMLLFSVDLSLADLCKIFTVLMIMGMFARPLRYGVALGGFAAITMYFQHLDNPDVFVDRDFFGLVRVRYSYERDAAGEYQPKYLLLIHGDIDHGWQKIDKAHRRDPITYFHPKGGVGQVFEKFNWFTGGKDGNGQPGGGSAGFAWPDYRIPAAMAGLGASPFDPGLGALLETQSEPAFSCIGLGIGTLGAHAKPFQYVRFYEIQPAVKRLSMPTDPNKEPIFSFIQDALDRGSDIDVVLGDGRLTLNKARVEKYYHIIVIDAFSSDAIPVHLLTREALTMYLSKLAEGGLLVFNTTNRYVDLQGPLRDLADDLDLWCYHYGDYNSETITRGGEKVENPDYVKLMNSSDWVVLQRKHINRQVTLKDGRVVACFNGGAAMPGRLLPAPFRTHTWTQPEGLGGPVWTDRYSNLLRVMHWSR